mmetsp:Transcript_1700/g.4014  ORF Transcript_1700/g.4014 Transcript_1700/m.4014 type:complete len:249 (+) Transcript_1700:36-782(+)|eukprot:CAMPEP_0180151272 /NCGR_PEP_ID=MMETSP0986-20121125/22021_1 /TAXON_ID=697907 /ORGANISM="non described non described, Strain CCMP2293" /LENGTH=248 /DNA_ID=CAMNT_0022098517 /DNA_START=35 /DNA_END=781 /DNA_ORIENTATION=+
MHANMLPRLALCATLLACASAFAPAGAPMAARSFAKPAMALRSAARPVARRVAGGASMQVQELSDAAGHMLVAAGPIQDAATSYFNLFVPAIKSIGIPAAGIKWLHGANMGLVLVAVGGFASALGWQIRGNPKASGELAALGPFPNFGKTTADLHKELMGVMTFIFFLGAQGGLALQLVQGKPIMESAHFTSALVGFALLATQATLTTTFKGENAKTGRTVHAFLGSATMGVFFFHAYQGLQLGLSLP